MLSAGLSGPWATLRDDNLLDFFFLGDLEKLLPLLLLLLLLLDEDLDLCLDRDLDLDRVQE